MKNDCPKCHASKFTCDYHFRLRQMVTDLLSHSTAHYGHAKDQSCGVGAVQKAAQEFVEKVK